VGRFFIIGATGYIGQKLYSKCLSLDIDVVGTSSKDLKNFLYLDLADTKKSTISFHSSDVIFFTSSISSPDLCENQNSYARNVNITGTSEVIKVALGAGAKVIFFSSDTVYGEMESDFKEGENPNPYGAYAEMKQTVESLFLGNPLFKSIRLSYVFSKEDRFSDYLVNCANNNEEAEVFHPFFRSIIFRDDVIQGVLALATRWDEIPEKIINFGGPEVLSRIDLAKCLIRTSLTELTIRIVEPEPVFFKNRPRVIAMKSPVLERILGRKLLTLCDASRLEFGSD